MAILDEEDFNKVFDDIDNITKFISIRYGIPLDQAADELRNVVKAYTTSIEVIKDG